MLTSAGSRRNAASATRWWRVENRIGPTLFGVVGRPAGSVPGFQYTADHKKLGITWDAATLDKYLANPRAMVLDTSMIYPGLKNDAERADLIEYLETLH